MPFADDDPTLRNRLVNDAAPPGRSRVAFRTIGCKLNQCETAQMQEALAVEGYDLVDWDSPADVRVINTCTVTSRSDKTCRNEIRHAKRLDPDCVVAVTGCYAQVDAEAIAAIPGVDLVLGNLDKRDLAGHLRERLANEVQVATPTGSASHGAVPETAGVRPAGDERPPRPGAPLIAVSPYVDRPRFESDSFSHFHGYTRAFLKIQNGCDSRCAYCIIPLARGPARSMPQDEVLAQVDILAARGYREVVLTGINLGSWGRDTGEGSLADLLRALVGRDRPERYRLSSIEPLETDATLQQVVLEAGDRVAHHFHLPLQSGCDSVLERMNRPYTAREYLETVESLARLFPDAALGADLIAGFPGETDEEFHETLSFVKHTSLTYLHVFAYSDRPRTAASALGPKVSPETIHERSLLLRALGERKKAAFRERLAGTEQRVLILSHRSPEGRLVGLSGNYLEILLDGDDSLMNTFAVARVDAALADGYCEGTLVGG
jgi:threonylcarbamoyladenosine tRNA methylthiotransferase MtaB